MRAAVKEATQTALDAAANAAASAVKSEDSATVAQKSDVPEHWKTEVQELLDKDLDVNDRIQNFLRNKL